MTPSRRLHLTLAALLAASVLAPGVAAEDGQVSADKVSYHGGADMAGDLAAFYFGQLTLDAAAPAPENPRLDVHIKADQFEALAIDSHYLVGTAGGASQQVGDPRYPAAPPANRTVLDHAQARLVAQQDGVQMHLLPGSGAGSLPFKLHAEAGEFTSVSDLAMSSGHFAQAGPTDTEDRTPEGPDFWSVRSDQPLVTHEDQAGAFSASFTGDCVLEILGGTFEAQGQGKKATLESGTWEAPVAGGGLPVPPTASAQRVVMLRIFLTGATIEVSSQGGSPNVYFASPDVASDQGGESLLLGTTGDIKGPSGESTLKDEDFTLASGNTLRFTPAQDRLAITVAPTARPPATQAGALALDGQPTTVLAVVAVLALVAAVAIGLLRRTGTTDLREVEAALEAQRYGRAARLAKRILRARPGLEDAVLGRAIALSKSGRAGAAIAELHAHLAKRGATDGSLHYVLGLAFLDVGRVEDARSALGEAVRLTPALAADVASRLGPQGSSPHATTLREVHGYA